MKVTVMVSFEIDADDAIAAGKVVRRVMEGWEEIGDRGLLDPETEIKIEKWDTTTHRFEDDKGGDI